MPILSVLRINESTSIDHYLPKSAFPEFSIYSYNLIPCCLICNSLKGESYIENGNQKFVNLYFDDILDIKFIDANIEFRRTPFFKFTLINNLFESYTIDTVFKSHCIGLDLLKRYEKVSSDELSHSIRLAKGKRVLKRNELRKIFERQEELQQSIKGNNYWRTVYYEAAKKSNDFIDYCIDKIR